jgi:hypothetical protein
LNDFHIHQIITRGSTIRRKKRLADRRRERKKDNYPLTLMSKGEREQRHGNREHMHEDRGSMRRNMSVTMPSVFPSMPKGDIFEILFFIDFNL